MNRDIFKHSDHDLEQFIHTARKNLLEPNPAFRLAAESRNKELTKPSGSLGRLEELALWYAGWQGAEKKDLESVLVTIFAGNHGVARNGVSAFPTEVTSQMVANFKQGGAAINQLASLFPSTLKTIPIALDRPTEDFTCKEAMTKEDFAKAFFIGFDSVDEDYDLVIPGEMGIGNTTSAAAVAAALFEGDTATWTGKGTGINNEQLSQKIEVINKGLDCHKKVLDSPLEILRCLGGREMAALAGSILSARVQGIPVILDGFICTSVAAVLYQLDTRLLDHVVAGHCSAENAHGKLLKELQLVPLLELGMRLGEASGASVAVHILRAAIKCYGGMATFAEAMVANKN